MSSRAQQHQTPHGTSSNDRSHLQSSACAGDTSRSLVNTSHNASTSGSTTVTRSASECNKWELSTYEQGRAPQEVITDHDTRMALHPECLRNDFMCPICLKLQSNTVTVMGCLHRFCKECIVKALSNTSKECAVCRTRLPNKRYLRADPNFDMLIQRIFPLREEEFDDFNYPTSNAANSSSANGSINNSTSRLRPRQNTRRSLRSTRLAPYASPHESLSITAPDGSTTILSNGLISPKSLAPVESEIEVIFKPLSIDHELGSDNWLNQVRYIKTSPSATVDHLIKYLSLRYKIDSKLAGEEEVNPDESLFTLCVANGPGQFQGLTVNQVLMDIQQVYFKSLPEKPIELYFAYNIGITDELTAEGESTSIDHP